MYTDIPLLGYEMDETHHELRHSYVNFTFTFQYVRYCCQKAYVRSIERGGSLSNIVTSLNPLIMNHSYAVAWVGGSVQVLPMQMFWANKPSWGLMFDCLLFEVV